MQKQCFLLPPPNLCHNSAWLMGNEPLKTGNEKASVLPPGYEEERTTWIQRRLFGPDDIMVFEGHYLHTRWLQNAERRSWRRCPLQRNVGLGTHDSRATAALVKSLSDLFSDYKLVLCHSANLYEKERWLKPTSLSLCLPTSLSFIHFLSANVKDFKYNLQWFQPGVHVRSLNTHVKWRWQSDSEHLNLSKGLK